MANNSKTVQLRGLVDTGNSLTCPITNKPVSIVEKRKIENILSDNDRTLYIPYNSLGKKSGLLKAYIIEKVLINETCFENVVIGIYDGKLSSEYNMIIHPAMSCGELKK
jgi:stage II sporulation protein GA (sporulation sigma-E factor processing peptidase)